MPLIVLVLGVRTVPLPASNSSAGPADAGSAHRPVASSITLMISASIEFPRSLLSPINAPQAGSLRLSMPANCHKLWALAAQSMMLLDCGQSRPKCFTAANLWQGRLKLGLRLPARDQLAGELEGTHEGGSAREARWK